MKSDDEQGSPGCHSLAQWMCARREGITRRWLDSVRRSPDIHQSDNLTRRQLIDHLPKLFDDLADTLRTAAMSRGDPVRQEGRRAAREHGHHRWEQNYSLSELLSEIGIIRRLTLEDTVEAFAAESGALSRAELQQARELVDMFFEDSAIGSVQQFVADQQSHQRHLTELLQRTTDALTETNERLNRIDASRLLMLRTVSHELGNGLYALEIATTVLRRAPDDAARDSAMDLCQRGFADVYRLLTELSDYSTLLAGRVTPALESFDAAELLAEVDAAFRPMAQTAGLELHTDADPDLAEVVSDRLRLKQILANLLTNAIKYCKSDPGAAGRVSVRFEAASPHTWRLVVEDNGIGIAPEHMEVIFEEFERVLPRAGVQGMGLGLAITKQLVGLLAGEIKATSEPGGGTRVEVVLPRKPSPMAAHDLPAG